MRAHRATGAGFGHGDAVAREEFHEGHNEPAPGHFLS